MLIENINIYDPLYNNNRYQFSDMKSLMVGSSDNGNSGIYITDEFRNGYTGVNETYDNPTIG